MIPLLRHSFNQQFRPDKYAGMLDRIEKEYPHMLDFRIAETPVFIPNVILRKMMDTCEYVIDRILSPTFKKLTAESIPEKFRIGGPEEYPQFMVFDFGIFGTDSANAEPMLIELQGFPSLLAYQSMLSELMRDYTHIPEQYSSYLNGYDAGSHQQLLKDIILGKEDPLSVILLEILPEKQKTRIDFAITEKMLGIKTVCFSKIKREGNSLYYEWQGKKQKISRIFNRMIFEDPFLIQYQDSINDLFTNTDLTWVSHPNWYYRISKYLLPFLDHPNIPASWFLDELKEMPRLSDHVLKPLYSFAGAGVNLDVKLEDIEKIEHPREWILQRKVNYLPVIQTPDEAAKLEIRLFYYWPKGMPRPIAIHNLARLSKGSMIGTRYNKDKDWVGGSIAFFEQP